MYAPRLVTPPAEAVLTLAEAKAALRLTTNADDALVTGFVTAATAMVDGPRGRIGRCLVTQSWSQAFDGFDAMRLPVLASSVTSVTYYDAAGSLQTLAPATYALREDGVGSFVDLAYDKVWPTVASRAEGVTVTYVAGFGAASAVPQPIKEAIRLLVMDLYFGMRDRAIRKEVVDGVGSTEWQAMVDAKDVFVCAADALLAPYRQRWL